MPALPFPFSQKVMIGCGALGSNLCRLPECSGGPVELLNLNAPHRVSALLREYAEHGSEILVTNTFSANPPALNEVGREDACSEINRRGVELAREAAAGKIGIWGSVGPLRLGFRLDDYTDQELENLYCCQCRALQNADALLLETFTEEREAAAALRAAGQTGLPIIFQVGNLGRGSGRLKHLDALVQQAVHAKVAAIGTNCQHPEDIIDTVQTLLNWTDLPVTAAPNAGQPRILRGVVSYEFSPADLAATALRLAAMGVSLIGGCCGTTPAHIQETAKCLGTRPVAARSRTSIPTATPAKKGAFVISRPAPNPIRQLINSEKLVVSVEIRAERRMPLKQILAGAAEIAGAGADLFDVPDNAGATVGRDPAVVAARLQQELTIPSFCHMAVTHANLLQIHSRLLGCGDLGLRGLLAVTGDSPSMGHLAAMAHRVTDLRSSVELLRLIRELRQGRIANGDAVSDPPDLCVGCAVGQPVSGQIRWLQKKKEAGAEFIFSQPVFTFDNYQKLRDATATVGLRLFPGILPLTGQKNASFLAAGRIPGIRVPEKVVTAFEKYTQPADQRRFGLEQAQKLALRIAADAQSLYLIMPFGKSCYLDTAEIVRLVKTATPTTQESEPV